MLPINDLGEPDFEYMEQYSKNMMLRKYQQYLAFLDTKKWFMARRHSGSGLLQR